MKGSVKKCRNTCEVQQRRKTLEEIKRDRINFDENVKTITESVFFKNKMKCFKCQKTGHIAKDCRLKKTFHEQTKASQMKCFKCGEHGHIVKFCRKQQKPEKNCKSK